MPHWEGERESKESQEQGVSEIPFFILCVCVCVCVGSFTCYKFPRPRQLGPSGGGDSSSSSSSSSSSGGGGGNVLIHFKAREFWILGNAKGHNLEM